MEALKTIVAEVLAEAQASGATITARQVRAACEKKLNLPPDGLLEKKEAIMAMINVVLESGGSGAGGNGAGGSDQSVDPEAVKAAVAALEDEDSGPTTESW